MIGIKCKIDCRESLAVTRSPENLIVPTYLLELVSKDDEVNESDHFGLVRSPFIFDPQLSNYYRQPNGKTKALYFLFRGNIRKSPQRSETTHNVFGIQVGVSVNIFIRKSSPQFP